MTASDIRILDYNKFTSKRFSHWVKFMDLRNHTDTVGRKGRLSLIRYLETLFGKIGLRWQYQKDHNSIIILRFDQETDLLIFLLKFKKG